MVSSYFRSGWRNVLKHKGYSAINVGGLALGMAVAMLIGLWINDELSFNQYHDHCPRVARVMRNLNMNGETLSTPILPTGIGEELRTKYGNHFDRVVMEALDGDHVISNGEEKLSLHGGFIEPDGPELFSFRMLQGTRSGLSDPHSVLLSQSAAITLFGNENAIGKVVRISNSDRMDVKVTGIFEDFPYNSSFHGMQFYAPYKLAESVNPWMLESPFTNDFLNVYVVLANQTDFIAASEQIKDVILDNVRENKQYVSVNPQLTLHAMKDWHLRSEWKNGVVAGGAIRIVWLFGFVGGFVLLLACINFMNLSTARADKRSKEVGIRKAVGSARKQLIQQFFIESFVMVGLAYMGTIVAVSMSLNWFNELSGKQMEMPWTNLAFWLISFAFIFFTGIIAGSYPAFYLSSFNAVKVLKGSIRVGRLASLPRKALVVMQFTVSVTLIIGTIIVYKQIQFAKDRPIGYSRDGLMMIRKTSSDFNGKYDALLTELKRSGAVVEASESSSPPTAVWTQNGGFDWNGKDPGFTPQWATLTVTPEYGKTVGWQFVDGRDFSRDIAGDSAAFVINEAAAKLLGFDHPVGETIRWQGGWRSKYNSFTVIGIVKDMVMQSPYAPALPSVFFLSNQGTNWINVKINPSMSAAAAVPVIETVMKKVVPSVIFDYKFADQEYALKFAAEERVGQLSSIFSAIAIFISCLGLFGLASFVAEQRTKEIGIRKVVGASVFSLWQMLSKDFITLVVISCLVSCPLAWYFLTEWLKNYEYRTEISWWIFLVASAGALMITLATVSYQAIKAAIMKPVKSLRSE